MKTLSCPTCGAPVQLAFGRVQTFCEYCGCQIRDQLSEAESATVGKNRDFVESIDAGINCIKSNDYESALKYADKAESFLPSDPAPSMIRFVCYLNNDFNKSQASYSIVQDQLSRGGSVAISQERFKDILAMYFMNYIDDREKDFKRMFASFKKVKYDDIRNVASYENTKRIRYFTTNSELTESMKETSSSFLSEVEKTGFSGSMDQANWNAITQFREGSLFKMIGASLLNAESKPKAADLVSRYSQALDMKWESAFKQGVSGSKDMVKSYRNEAEVILYYLKK